MVSHRFCSYNEVHQFEQNAVLSYGTGISNYSTQFFVQYIADNFDHIKTLKRYNTFCGMGMIATVTPANKKSNQILKVNVTSKDIAAIWRVPIHYHRKESLTMTMVTYEKLYRVKVIWLILIYFNHAWITKASMIRNDGSQVHLKQTSFLLSTYRIF